MHTGSVRTRALNVAMPARCFPCMTDNEPKAIFAYLRRLEQVKYLVDNTEPPTLCRVCGKQHGYGSRNQVAGGWRLSRLMPAG